MIHELRTFAANSKALGLDRTSRTPADLVHDSLEIPSQNLNRGLS